MFFQSRVGAGCVENICHHIGKSWLIIQPWYYYHPLITYCTGYCCRTSRAITTAMQSTVESSRQLRHQGARQMDAYCMCVGGVKLHRTKKILKFPRSMSRRGFKYLHDDRCLHGFVMMKKFWFPKPLPSPLPPQEEFPSSSPKCRHVNTHTHTHKTPAPKTKQKKQSLHDNDDCSPCENGDPKKKKRRDPSEIRSKEEVKRMYSNAR